MSRFRRDADRARRDPRDTDAAARANGVVQRGAEGPGRRSLPSGVMTHPTSNDWNRRGDSGEARP